MRGDERNYQLHFSISFKHSLEQYNKKYKHLTYNLAKLTKTQVRDFDLTYGHYHFNKKTYTLNFHNYLLVGKKWWLIDDTYYEVPRPIRYTWFRNLKTSTQILTSVLLGGAVVCSIGLPLYFTLTNKVISTKIEDLLPESKEERAYIIENCYITNTRVVLGKDFDTVVQLKDEKVNDFNINNIRIFTFKDETSSNSNLAKVELTKGKDFVIDQEKKKATIKVFSTSFNNKLEINVKLKEINFDRFVNFEDKRFGYDENGHAIKFTLKEGKELPNDTLIKYTYLQETKTGDQFFTFTDVGTYKVTLQLTAPEFNDYSKTINVIIDKKELSDYQKTQIYFVDGSLKKKVGSITHPDVKNDTGVPATSESEFEYFIDGKWTTTLPDKKGTYKVKKTLRFKNYNDYTLIDNFIVDPYAMVRITFDVKSSGGTWGNASSEDIMTDAIEMFPTGIKFGVFIDNLKTKIGYKEPTKIGHSFNGVWYDNEATLLDKDSIVNYPDSYTVKAKFDINSYKVNFDPNGGTITTSSTNLEYNKPILENISGFSKPTHTSGLFKGWGESKETRETISSTLKMPANDITLYALWYKYDFEFIDGDHGKAVTEAGTTLSNLISLKEKPTGVTITPDNGYEFTNKYDVYFGETLSLPDFSFTGSNEIAPGQYSIKEDTSGNNVKIRIKPKFDALKIKAIIEPDGGVVKKGEDIVTTLDIKCGDAVINYLTGMTATKDHTVFENKWLITSGSETKEIDGNTLMPATPVTIRPKYHTYTINVVGDDNVTIDESTIQFTNRITLHSDEIKYTFNDGYLFKEFQYSFDGTNYAPLVYGMPFIPYDYDKSFVALHDTIYLKVISEEIKETMQVYVDAGTGYFPDGSNFKVVTCNKGKTFQNVLDTLGDVKKGTLDPTHWIDKDNNTINLNTPITGVDIYYAKAIFAEEVNNG